MKKAILTALIILSTTGPSRAADIFKTYTIAEDFNAVSMSTHMWDFEELPVERPAPNITNVKGPGSVTLIKGRTLSYDDRIPVLESDSIDGVSLYVNPQDARGTFMFDEMAKVNAFGIYFTWSDYFNPSGIGSVYYDADENVIGTLSLSGTDAYASHIWKFSQNAPEYLYYDGFMGVLSSTEIARVAFIQESPGSIFYDNVVWEEGEYVPTSIVDAPKAPTLPKSPSNPTTPTAPQTPKSPTGPVSPTPPNLNSLFTAFAADDNGPAPAAYLESQDIQTTTNPEPMTLLLFGGGMAGALLRRRSLRKAGEAV